ncbi:MAG: class I SAM-dependent methyltransferase [Solirubrobacteraceae bacterium]
MVFAINRVINVEDFAEPTVRETIREVFEAEVEASPRFPDGKEQRKQWEVAMAVLALREGGVMRPDAQVLGIGAGTEATLFWLTNHIHRVWATDLYGDPGVWSETAAPKMLIDPGSAWNGPWNPRRLVVQHMDACELAYEDETFDGVFSSGSIEHFGSLERISVAMDEAFRVLKPGGTASFSTEFLVEGDPLLFENETVMFTPDLIEQIVLGNRDWALVTPIDYTLSDATVHTEIGIEDYWERPRYPHCALRKGPNLLTSIHVALRKAPRPAQSANGAAPGAAGPAAAPTTPATAPPPSPPAGKAGAGAPPARARARVVARQFLRKVSRLPYHPILWRLERNYQHSSARDEAIAARLSEVERAIAARLSEVERLPDANRRIDSLRATIESAQRTLREMRAANDSSRDAIAEWSVMVARELEPSGAGPAREP